MNSLLQGMTRAEACRQTQVERPGGARDSGAGSRAHADPVQAWRAWADCGDGRQFHLIIDPHAQQLWLLPADETLMDPRSMR